MTDEKIPLNEPSNKNAIPIVPIEPIEKPSNEKIDEFKEKKAEPKKSKKMMWIFTFFLLLAGISWLLLWIFYLQYYVDTDDAYASGSVVNINPAVQGNVIAFYADDTDYVEEGQLLVELDPTFYSIAYDQALASLGSQALQIRELVDEVLVNAADVRVKEIVFSKAKYDFENRSKLVGSRAISQEDYTHSRDDLTVAENELQKAKYRLKISQDLLGNTSPEKHPLIEEKKSRAREAYYNLKHTKIFAPTSGYVAKRAVNVGQSVARGTNLMAIVPISYVWVDANFKETQLTNMRIGQPATVWFDLYGSKVKYIGQVLGIGMGSGSAFSLIPPQNATGNWIKIVQRLPVRISLDPEVLKKYPIRIGISAEVEVDITEQNLPLLATVPPSKPVAVTNVYDIDMQDVNEIIDSIVQEQLLAEIKEP